MDPNATLMMIRSLVGDVLAGEVSETEAPDALSDLAQAFRDLDDWRMAGGFLPADWSK